MMESVFVVLLIASLWLAKQALFADIDTSDRLAASTIAMFLFFVLAFSSLGVTPTFDAGDSVSMEAVAWLSFVGGMLMLVFALTSVIDTLREVREKEMLKP